MTSSACLLFIVMCVLPGHRAGNVSNEPCAKLRCWWKHSSRNEQSNWLHDASASISVGIQPHQCQLCYDLARAFFN